MQARREAKALRLLGCYCPAGEQARQFVHVLLGIASMHTQRMQFHQFARVIFIQATALIALHGAVGHALRLIEVIEHGRMAAARKQQFIEMAKHVRTNGVQHVVPHERLDGALVHRDIEVVEPEFGQAGQQGVFDIGAAARGQAPGGGFAGNAVAVAKPRVIGRGGCCRSH